MIEIERFDKAVIVSGDGDFHCLVEYLESKNKLEALLVPNKSFSSLLKEFNDNITRLDLLRDILEKKKDGDPQSVETLSDLTPSS